MDLTPENKAAIDSKTYYELLHGNRFLPLGSSWMTGETGDYWITRMAMIRSKPGGDALHTQTSKAIGW